MKAGTSAESDAVEEQSVTTGKKKPILDEGALASVACSLLMKVLWAARLARPDLYEQFITSQLKLPSVRPNAIPLCVDS